MKRIVSTDPVRSIQVGGHEGRVRTLVVLNEMHAARPKLDHRQKRGTRRGFAAIPRNTLSEAERAVNKPHDALTKPVQELLEGGGLQSVPFDRHVVVGQVRGDGGLGREPVTAELLRLEPAGPCKEAEVRGAEPGGAAASRNDNRSSAKAASERR